MAGIILQAPLLGLALGFVSSMPIGPINIRVGLMRQEGRGRPLALFLAGVVTADLAIALLALLGLVQAHLSAGLLRWVGLGGGGLLVAYAAWGLFRRGAADAGAPRAAGRFPEFAFGVLLCAGNPAFFLFWVYGSAELLAFGEPGWVDALLYLGGIALGDLAWFALYLRGVGWLQPRVGGRLWARGSYALTGLLGLYSIGRSLDGAL